MDRIELARDCCKTTCYNTAKHIYSTGAFDNLHEMRSALAMHDKLKEQHAADIKELLEALVEAVVPAEGYLLLENIAPGYYHPDTVAELVNATNAARAAIKKFGEK